MFILTQMQDKVNRFCVFLLKLPQDLVLCRKGTNRGQTCPHVGTNERARKAVLGADRGQMDLTGDKLRF